MNSAGSCDVIMIVLGAVVLGLCDGAFAKVIHKSYSQSQDQKLMGDLHYMRDFNIHSLAWVVQLSPTCNIDQIIKNNISCLCNNVFFKNFLSQNLCKLLVLKELTPFINTFLVAHPYYRMYKRVKKKFKKHYYNFILNKNLLIENGLNVTHKNANKYLYTFTSDAETFIRIEDCVQRFLSEHPCVEVVNQEVLRDRSKRSKIQFIDPLYKIQWHLKNNASGEYDMNVIGAWESGITGHGVTVCVIDDGLEWRHPDLKENYNPRGSYDLNADDLDPSPVKNGEKNEHGTRCAGEIAAVANNVCGVGVAYRASISGIRVLGERMTDSLEAAAFVQGLAVNDVYSCSWGPNDDGKTVDGPHYLAKKALVHGITYGRNGYGAIYVVASGNGGKNEDNCNFDGYANSVYTVTIGAVDSRGAKPYYAEECATMLAVTPSSGSNGKAIVTTDWRVTSKSGCTLEHSGTSAAAPLAAAVIALTLEMQPYLSWRDVQYLIALTSRKIDVKNSNWIVNKAGLHHSHQHGFGLMDATGLVSAAAIWKSVSFSTSFTSSLISVNKVIPSVSTETLIVNQTVEKDLLKGYALQLLEFVQVYVTLEHEFRGSLKIGLTCPSGTKSVLAPPRPNDNSTKGLQNWPLGTVRCWGEVPWGVYSLSMQNTHSIPKKGKLISIQIALHGTPMTQRQFQKRRRLVKRALKGEVIHVNRSNMLHPPESNFVPFTSLSEQTIKILLISGMFLFLMTISNTFEYILCYNSEKKKFYIHLRDLVRSRSLALSKRISASSHLPLSSLGDQEESLTLLETTLVESLSQQSPEDNTSRFEFSDDQLTVSLQHSFCVSSPTPSCEGDVSSLNANSDDEEGTISSRNTSGTVVPRDTDASTTTTDFTTDHTTSEPDELEKKFRLKKEYHL